MGTVKKLSRRLYTPVRRTGQKRISCESFEQWRTRNVEKIIPFPGTRHAIQCCDDHRIFEPQI